MSDDLAKRLRQSWDADRSIMSQTERWMAERVDAADRIEELEAKLDWVLVERDETFALMLDRAQTAEAKLAKAVEVAEKSIKWLRLYGADVHREAATLAELTGGKDE